MTFSKYESYKDSGVEWLGEIPSHWEIKRLGFEAQTIVPMRDKPTDLSGEVPWIRIEDFDGKYIFSSKSGQGVSQQTVRRMNLKVFPENTVLCSCSCNMGMTAIAKQPLVSNQTFIGIYPFKSFSSDFLFYLLNASQRYLTEISTGAIQQYLSKDDFRSLRLPAPSLEEQKRIVEFLDRTTTDIDRAIAQKQRLIELLQEQKAILINQAVTKGLNPNVPMKDSGIEWIGEIPEHWGIKKLGFLSNLLQTGPFGSQLHQEDYIEGGIPAINPSQLIDGEIRPDYKISVSEKTALRLERHRLIEGDIVFGRRGEMGRCGLVTSQEVGWLCGTGSILFRPKTEDISPSFALEVLRSHCIKSILEYISVGATMDNLNTAILSKISLPVPPLDEQKEIVIGIEKIKKEFSKLIGRELNGINLLNEMRQVMIASAVTGKIKV
jgi:type I restriction enzyme, S subunit